MANSSTPRPSLISLDFDILLSIFAGLDTQDVIRVGMTCRTLYELTKERRIWWDQTQDWYKKNPVLKHASSWLDPSPVENLRDFAVRQSKLRSYWGQEYEPAKRYTSYDGFPRYARAWLMPGGTAILLVSIQGSAALHRIPPPGTQPSIEAVPFATHQVEPSLHDHVSWVRFLPAVSPYPVFACTKGPRLYLLSIDYEHGRICPEKIVLPIAQPIVSVVRGQGRVLIVLPTQPLATSEHETTMVAVHLDYPETTLEIRLPTPPVGGSPIFDICLPCPGVVVAYLHRTNSIFLYKLPDFSTLRPGVNTLREAPHLITQLTDGQCQPQIACFGADIYDQGLAPYFHLHFGCTSDCGDILLTLRVDSSTAGFAVTEVSQLFLTLERRHSDAGEGVLFFSHPRLNTSEVSWLHIIPVSEPGWDEWRRALIFRLPAKLPLGAAPELDFDLISGRLLFTHRNGHHDGLCVYIAEIT
ncbi:hypothetical protein BDM02DRAFT_3271535 [Thelephora ganbajun]|uniref:Uncharacterized protein n=1 Tax=Thelephora ganbajun TaxID=370292 RepID=A0ACB6Z8F7_THEGA|nr:hypothetical protein BDM02DRAFT_3271535 [Thelephora ganbajun]